VKIDDLGAGMSQKRAWIVVALATVFGSLPVVAARSSTDESLAADTGYFQEIVPIAPGVWVLAEPRFQVQPIGNVTVIEQRDGLVLVDAGGSAGSGRRIVEMVRSLSPKPVKAIIVSQWHGDKAQGLTELLKAWPNARTIATAPTQAHLADPKTMNTPAAPDTARNVAFVKAQLGAAAELDGQAARTKVPAQQRGFAAAARMFRQYALDVDGTLTLAPKEGFIDRLVIADRRRPVEALFLGRANTDGDAVVWLPRQRILVAGETVIAPFPYGYESYPASWIEVLRKLRALRFRTLIPGHGPPEHDARQIDRIGAALRAVEAQVAPLAKQGLTLAQVQAKIDFGAQRSSLVGDDPWLGLWFKAFWVQPIVASAYREATGQPIVQSLTP
jgi:glyoxylase-like metal-dependent hydrolase (beta-lactamase superfamily II)